MDTYLAIASKRDWRRYQQRAIPDDVVTRILDAGRLAGSARNLQPWRFVVVETPARVEEIAETVYAPDNVRGAALVVAIVTEGGRAALDCGRAVQNMFVAAWNDGVASCPNGMPEAAKTANVLELTGGEEPVIVLSFGYPEGGRPPESRSAEEWSRRANRKPLDEVVGRI